MPHPTGGYHGGRLHLLKAFGLCCIAVTLFYGGFQSAMFVCKVRAGRGLPWQESKEAFAGKTFSSTSDVEQKLEVLHQATQQQAIRQQELERQLKEQRELLLQRRPGRKSYSKRLAGGPHHQEDLGHPNGKQPRSPSEQPDEVQDREQERDQIATHARTTSGRHLRPFTEYDPDFFTAQNGQDKYMYIKHFQRRPELLGKGVFVEFGARNGLKHSNTYFFEKALGWMGVMVEADVREYPTLPVNRPNTVPVFGALTNRDGDTVDFMVSRFAGWSGFVDEYNEHRMGNSACPCAHIHVPSYRLNTILDRAGIKHVHYMSVDTEGSELSILKTIDFGKIYIEFLQVEVLMLPQTLETDINNRQAITELLQSNGFKVIHVISTGSDTLDLFFRNTLEAPVGMSMDQNSPESHREARTHFVSESSKSLERVRKEIADAGIDVPRNQGDRKLRRSLR